MRRSRMVAVAGAVALATTTFGATNATAVAPPSAAGASAAAKATDLVVFAKKGVDAQELADRLSAAGGTVTGVNTAVGMVTVHATDAGFLAAARKTTGVQVAAADSVVGHAPKDVAVARDAVERPRPDGGDASHGKKAADKKGKKGASDPLDSLLWGMDMLQAQQAHRIETGDKRVKVGVMDTGVDASHPDIAPNFDAKLSRNFTTDADDPLGAQCQYGDCKDPADVDDDGHGTHVAGTIAGALNGIGVSGVAPSVDIVNVRAGQDSGYFLLGPTVDALTYSGDAGLDVVNMSFYVDPYAYNCEGGAPEDSPEEVAQQEAVITGINRALEYAHSKGVTLVAALGNGYDDLANPRVDTSSPDYGPIAPHPRTIDGQTCYDLPVEGPHVVGVSSVGPTERKAYYSNYTTDLTSGEIEVSAPGGDYYDSDPAPNPANLILSAAPLSVLQATGDVDADGNITPAGEGFVLKDCRSVKGKGKGDREECGYYQYLQGTSMASPHAAGVAALIVSRYGTVEGRKGFTLDPDRTAQILMDSARGKACPNGDGGVYDYAPPIPTAYNATCVGTADFNGFYGAGIVNALNAVSGK